MGPPLTPEVGVEMAVTLLGATALAETAATAAMGTRLESAAHLGTELVAARLMVPAGQAAPARRPVILALLVASAAALE